MRITVEPQGLGFLVRVWSIGLRGSRLSVQSIEQVCHCVRHYYGSHAPGEAQVCPVCRDNEAKRKATE